MYASHTPLQVAPIATCPTPPLCTHAVLGPMDPSDLGVTLTHEHLLLDFVKATELRTKDYVDKLADLDLQMKNLGKIQHYPYAGDFVFFYTHNLIILPAHTVTASQLT